MKLLMIAKSNIRKNKNLCITLVILIILATVLLYIGTSVVLEMNSFIDNKNSELNGSDFLVMVPKLYSADAQKAIEELGDIRQLEPENLIRLYSASMKNITKNDKSDSTSLIIMNADAERDISKLKIINEGKEKLQNSIILPYYLKTAKSYKTGDEISVTSGNKTNTYVVYGFAEDIMFATPSNVPIYKCYLFNDKFCEEYAAASEASQSVIYKTKLVEGTDVYTYSANFMKKINLNVPSDTIMTLEYESMKTGVSIFIYIIMSIIIVFSIIIILIALMILRFAIVTYVEGNIRNIGSMEAMGYTGKQLIFSTVLQFMLISLIGIVIGILAAVSSAGLVTNIISSSSGLNWDSKADIPAAFISLFVIMALILITAYMTAAKIKKVTPIMAMRNGLNIHNFKKNHFPFCKSPLGVNVTIGLKALSQNMKQNITIIFIVILMSFVSAFMLVINYNFNVDNTAFARLVGIEKAQLVATCNLDSSEKIFNEIKSVEHVKKTLLLTDKEMTLTYGDKELTPSIKICSDYDKLEIKTIVRGRYPIYDNEIAVTGLVMKRLKVKLGDVVDVNSDFGPQEFIIVGVTQQIEFLGKSACITEEGMKRIKPDYIPSQLYIYLDDSKNLSSVKSFIKEKYGDKEFEVIDYETQYSSSIKSFNNAILTVCFVGITFTAVIIALILYLIIKIKLLKERIHIGTAKALGYTTKQLIFQNIISFCPVCILGAIIGTILAAVFVNPVLSGMLSMLGILNCCLTIRTELIIAAFLAISGFSILITAFVAAHIRKITPCELFV